MQKVLIVQQNKAGERKAEGIKRFGKDRFAIEIIDIETNLPTIIDDGFEYLPEKIDADIVLDFLKHPDLSEDLAVLCERQEVSVVITGKKVTKGNAICPPT